MWRGLAYIQNGIECKGIRRAVDATGLHREVDGERLGHAAGLAGEGHYRAVVSRRKMGGIGDHVDLRLSRSAYLSRGMVEAQPGRFSLIPAGRPVDAARARSTQRCGSRNRLRVIFAHRSKLD